MNLSVNEDKVKVFSCPRCKQFILADVNKCRYCLLLISDETKNREIQSQEATEEGYRTNINKNILRIGSEALIVGLCGLPIALFTILFLNRVSPFILIFSGVSLLVGLKYTISTLYGNYRKKR